MKKPILFQRGNEPGVQITLTTVGDILMQGKTQLAAQNAINESINSPEARVASGFKALLEPVVSDFNRGDILFGNLETPIAPNLTPQYKLNAEHRYICECVIVPEGVLYDGYVYGETKYPKRRLRFKPLNFNAHPSLAIALKEIGFDIVSTANNHALDRGHNGIDSTINSLRAAGLDFIGTLHSEDINQSNPTECSDNCPYIIMSVKGIRVAFFSFTSFINPEFWGFQDESSQIFILPRKNQPNRREWFYQAIRSARKNPKIDFVVISIHWGIEFISQNLPLQRKLAYAILDAGADIILGHHSHVLQPMERYIAADGRETFIIYSLGNFTTDMPGIRSQTSIILYLGLTKNDKGTFLNGMQYLPVARQCVGGSDNGVALIQTVAIDRYPQDKFSRHRKWVIRMFGSGNLKEPDAGLYYPVP